MKKTQNSFKNEQVNCFICYPGEVVGLADFIINKRVIAKNIHFWLDHDLKNGEIWDSKIKANIVNCDVFIAFLFKETLYSEYIVKTELCQLFELGSTARILSYVQGKNNNDIEDFKTNLNGLIDFFGETEDQDITEDTLLIQIIDKLKIDIKAARFVVDRLNEYKKGKDDTYIKGLNTIKNKLFDHQVGFLDFNPVEEELLKNEKAFSKICIDIVTPIIDEYVGFKAKKEQNSKSIKYSEGNAYYFDKKSAQKVMASLAECDGGIYFNSQISLSDWFTDILALNLSMQKEIEEIIDYRVFITKLLKQGDDRPYPPILTRTRIARVLFLPISSAQIKEWNNANETDPNKGKQRYRDLSSLNNIHRMMGATMAVVSYDQLFDILFFQEDNIPVCYFDEKELGMLGINFMRDEQSNEITVINERKERLKELIIQQQVEPPFLKPAIDFAAFTHHGHRKRVSKTPKVRIDNSEGADFNFPWPERPPIENLNDLNRIIDGENILEGFELFRAGLADRSTSEAKLADLSFFNFRNLDYRNYETNSVLADGDETVANLRLKDHKFLMEETEKDKFLRTLIKFTFLMDSKIFERKKTNDLSKILGPFDSNTQIYNLNKKLIEDAELNSARHGCEKLKKPYIYKHAKSQYNVMDIFKNGR